MSTTALAAPTPRRTDWFARLRQAFDRVFAAPTRHARMVSALAHLDRHTLRDIGLEHMVAPHR